MGERPTADVDASLLLPPSPAAAARAEALASALFGLPPGRALAAGQALSARSPLIDASAASDGAARLPMRAGEHAGGEPDDERTTLVLWSKQRPCPAYPALRAALGWPAGRPLTGDGTLAAAKAAQHQARLPPPAIRQPAKRTTAPAAEAAIGQGADVALYASHPDGRQSFDIALDPELLGDVRCRIELTKAGIEATFVVAATAERWLLGGQTERLRLLLEERGLQVAAVRVIEANDPAAPTLWVSSADR